MNFETPIKPSNVSYFNVFFFYLLLIFLVLFYENCCFFFTDIVRRNKSKFIKMADLSDFKRGKIVGDRHLCNKNR